MYFYSSVHYFCPLFRSVYCDFCCLVSASSMSLHSWIYYRIKEFHNICTQQHKWYNQSKQFIGNRVRVASKMLFTSIKVWLYLIKNTLNPVYDAATICHKVTWMCWGHFSRSHTRCRCNSMSVSAPITRWASQRQFSNPKQSFGKQIDNCFKHWAKKMS